MAEPSTPCANSVLIGLLGPTLDQAKFEKRWDRWRPTISLFQHEDLLIHRLELLYQSKFLSLAQTLADDIHQVSPETEVNLVPIDFDDPWEIEEVYGKLADFARAYRFRPSRENYLIHVTTGTHVQQICLFLLTESRHLPGRIIQSHPPERMRSSKPGRYSIVDLDLSRYDRIAARFSREAADDISFLKSGIDTRNPAFNRLIERIEQVAIRSSAPILLTGPTGAGKSHLARRIYQLRHHRNQIPGAFVEANCATLRGDAAMSTLFGHRKGAFTGAATERKGLLRSAHNGVLFLDEIGELGPDEQAMLLRAVEEKTFLPLGSDKTESSEFQLICGTNHDLRSDVANGTFREDLLARINLWTFTLPGIAQRREDIEPNLDYELDTYEAHTGKRITFNNEARQAFLDFALAPDTPWLGNFRDINAAINRMATLAPGGRINRDVVREEIQRLRHAWERPETHASTTGKLLTEVLGPAAASLDLFDRAQLAEVIRVCRTSTSLAAAGRTLFAESRKKKKSFNDSDRLRKYLTRFDLTWSQLRPETEP